MDPSEVQSMTGVLKEPKDPFPFRKNGRGGAAVRMGKCVEDDPVVGRLGYWGTH